MVIVPYTFFSWIPPSLTSEQRVWLGQEISRVGKKAFTSSLKRRVTGRPTGKQTPFTLKELLDDAKAIASTGTTEPRAPLRAVLPAAIIFSAALALLIAANLIVSFLIVIGIIGPIVVGSLAWTYKQIDRWAQSLLDDYHNHPGKCSRKGSGEGHLQEGIRNQ